MILDNNDFTFKIYILTLDCNSSRFLKLKDHLDKFNITYSIFNGINGRKLKIEEITKNVHISSLCKKFCTRSMIGCGLSHIEIWKDIIKNNIDYALIIEDDTFVDFDMFKKYIKYFIKVSNIDNCGIIQLTGMTFLQKGSISFNKTNILFKKYNFHLQTGSYFINKNIAKRLLNRIKIKYHVDFTLNFLYLDNYIVEPNMATQLGQNESTMISDKKILTNILTPNLNYILNVPWGKIFNVKVNFMIIILLLCILLYIYFGMCAYSFIVIGVLFGEIVDYD